MIFADHMGLPIDMVGIFLILPNSEIWYKSKITGNHRKILGFQSAGAPHPQAAGPGSSAQFSGDGVSGTDYGVGWCRGGGRAFFPAGTEITGFPNPVISCDVWKLAR